MTPSREEALFALELEKPAEKRPAFLDAVCGGDTALRARLEALLAAHEQPETLLATQAETARPTIKLNLADAPDVMGSVNGIQQSFGFHLGGSARMRRTRPVGHTTILQ